MGDRASTFGSMQYNGQTATLRGSTLIEIADDSALRAMYAIRYSTFRGSIPRWANRISDFLVSFVGGGVDTFGR